MVSTTTDGELSMPYHHGQHDSILIKLAITSGTSQSFAISRGFLPALIGCLVWPACCSRCS
jgi:hypothetical protein